MQIATCWLIIDKNGSNIPLRNVTPAELVLLVRDRMAFVGRFPVHDLQVIGQSKRTDDVEKNRLRNKYGRGLHDEKGKVRDRDNYKVDVLYPGETAPLPETFKQTKLEEQASEKLLPTKIAPNIMDITEGDPLEDEKLDPVEEVDPMDAVA